MTAMISPRNRIAWLALLPVALALAVGRAEGQGGVIHTIDIPAPTLRGNLLGDPDTRAVSIYLPGAYADHPREHFPVIYLLHGFAADNKAFIAGAYQNLNVRISMDSLIAVGKVRPMIVVTPSARNRFDGSFYVNSPTTGRWEDFITHDLVGYIDRHFRTIPKASSRGLAGHSMGGYGTLYIGMRNPRVFSAIYALSPCCLGGNEHPTPPMVKAWTKTLSLRDTSQIRSAGFIPNLLMALAAVYSPDPKNPPFYVDYLFTARNNSLVLDSAVAARWKPPLTLVERYRSDLARLSIGFDAGRSDGFPDIPENVHILDEKLTSLGIPHFAEIYEGTHGSRIRERLETVVFPFFSRKLKSESGGSR